MKILSLAYVLVISTILGAGAQAGTPDFAQSLRNVKLGFNGDAVTLSFMLNNEELVSEDSKIQISGNSLSGTLTLLNRAKLTSTEQPEMTAWLRCTDDACAFAEIRLERANPGTATDVAFLRYTRVSQAAVLTQGDLFAGSPSPFLTTASTSLQDAHLSRKSLEIVDIQGADRSFTLTLSDYPRPMVLAFSGTVGDQTRLGVRQTFYFSDAVESRAAYVDARVQLSKSAVPAIRVLLSNPNGGFSTLVVGPASKNVDLSQIFKNVPTSLDDDAPRN